MAAVGLLYVGAVLFVNGLAFIGWVKGSSLVPMNLFVGILQVITPLYIIFTAGGDQATIIGASGLFLFGFTYLYVAMNNTWDYDGTGLGWFCLFVAGAAVVYSWWNFSGYASLGSSDRPVGDLLGVLWAHLGDPVVPVLDRARPRAGGLDAVHRGVVRLPGDLHRLRSRARPAQHPGCADDDLRRGSSAPSRWRTFLLFLVLLRALVDRRRSARPAETRIREQRPAPRDLKCATTIAVHRHHRRLLRRTSHGESVPARQHQEIHRPEARRPQPLAPRHPGGRQRQAGRRVPDRHPRVVRRRDPQR